MLSALDGISQSLDAYLVLAGLLFAIGSFGFLARRNAISMLMSIELMLNAVNLSIISFGAFSTSLNVDASVIALIVMAAAQVLVYIGAISVLVLFAIMLTQTKAGPGALVFQTQAFPAAIASAILALLIAIVVVSTDWPEAASRIPTSAVDLANSLFSDYVLAFEVVSVLLLAAVIGGVFLAKRERGGSS